MKKIILMFLFSIILLGCTSSDDFQNAEKYNQQDKNKISKEEAIGIADRILNKNMSTRTSDKTQVNLDFVLSNKKSTTRSASMSDTLAYIINYPNEEGFAIVSTSRKIFPVLGFSEKGHFSIDNENAKLNFIDKIEEYSVNTSDANFDNRKKYCINYSIHPIVKTTLNQRSPWDKYVLKENPDCPVGCVAVATALMLSHSMIELNYHGSTYYFKSIIEAISKKQNPDIDLSTIYAEDEWNKTIQPTYTYNQAVDSMAKLLYWIGKDLKIVYSPTGSSAYSSDAYALCKQLKGNTELKYSNFNIETITWLIKNGYIIYIDGRNTNGKGGHAWVSDGVAFSVMVDENERDILEREKIIDTYIHCDWGWDGSCNGYYCGNVFEVGNSSYRPATYFELRRGKNKLGIQIR